MPFSPFRKIVATGIFLFVAGISHGQEAQKGANYFNRKITMGIGLGLDYGGIGVRIAYSPVKYLDVFGGLGFNFIGLGANGGLSYNILPGRSCIPVVNIMYGYNAVLRIDDFYPYGSTHGPTLKKTYYGFTAGAGLKIRLSRKTHNFLYIGLNVPFRNAEFHRDYHYVTAIRNIPLAAKMLPVLFVIGYNLHT